MLWYVICYEVKNATTVKRVFFLRTTKAIYADIFDVDTHVDQQMFGLFYHRLKACWVLDSNASPSNQD